MKGTPMTTKKTSEPAHLALTIGALARLTWTNPAIIREYEALGLLPPPTRLPSLKKGGAETHRLYDEKDVQRLSFLRRCRDLGVLNPQLHLLVQLVDRPAEAQADAHKFADQLLSNVQDHLNEMRGLEKTLVALTKGAGESALTLGDTPSIPADGFKRMRRLVRKPLKTSKKTSG
jgi:MerR family copper efflux transcriptional regulator